MIALYMSTLLSQVAISMRRADVKRIAGHCPICEKDVVFEVRHEWLRDGLFCNECPGGSVPRERALALVLNELRPNWRALTIHESSPTWRGMSRKMSAECRLYHPSQYFPDAPFGTVVNHFYNENLEAQTWPSDKFDIVITLDVMEHVYNPNKVFAEVHRTLAVGGLYLCTFPVRKWQAEGWKRRFIINADGKRIDIEKPEYHGNPASDEGSIVTIDWGYDLHQAIPDWANFDVRVYRFSDRTHGILGEYTDVIACFKR